MLILLTIFLLFLIPLAMLILHIVWPKFSIQGFLTVLAVIAGWLMTYFARSNIPHSITLLYWQPAFYFPNSPSILIDKSSWFFSISLISLALVSVLSSIAHLGQSLKSELNQVKKQINVIEVPNQTDDENSFSKHDPLDDNKNTSNWQSWAGILVITAFGLVAVTAGNVLTLLLAWAGLDLITLVILIAQTQQTKMHTRTILVFSARMAGIGMVLFASILLWSKGASLNINEIGQTTSIYLILAAGLRLGVLPLQHPFIHQPDQRRELWTTLLLVSAAASLILLVRVATFGVSGPASLYFTGFDRNSWDIRRNSMDDRKGCNKRAGILGSRNCCYGNCIRHHGSPCCLHRLEHCLPLIRWIIIFNVNPSQEPSSGNCPWGCGVLHASIQPYLVGNRNL